MNRIQVLVRLIACVICVNFALTTGATICWGLAVVNVLLAAAWLLIPESNEPNDED